MSTELEEMVDAYIRCALWVGLDDGDSPLDTEGWTKGDLTPEAVTAITELCTEFLAFNRVDLDATGADPAQWGHDLHLTQNGHGAGFWDRGYGEVGDRLSAAARVYGDAYLYVYGDKLGFE